LNRDRERVLNRILGEIDVTEGADQDGNRAAIFLAEHAGDPCVGEDR
jgi:hypothetical protein